MIDSNICQSSKFVSENKSAVYFKSYIVVSKKLGDALKIKFLCVLTSSQKKYLFFSQKKVICFKNWLSWCT